MLERLQKLIDRIGTMWSIITAVAGTSVMAVITAWVGSYSTWVQQFGAIGWIFSGLFGGLVTASAICLIAVARYYYIHHNAMREWGKSADSINPLAEQFHNQRISIRELANPVTNKISGKRFIDCELMGPVNMVLVKGCSLTRVSFVNCDFFVIRPNRIVTNVVLFEDVDVIGGTLYSCTLLIPFHLVQNVRQIPGIEFATLTGVADLDVIEQASPPNRPA